MSLPYGSNDGRSTSGDWIYIHYPDRKLAFQVEKVFRTTPYDRSVLSPTREGVLTLTTCDPPGSDTERLIVWARYRKWPADGDAM